MSGIHLWGSVLFMCLGTVLLSLRQSIYLNNFHFLSEPPDAISPLEDTRHYEGYSNWMDSEDQLHNIVGGGVEDDDSQDDIVGVEDKFSLSTENIINEQLDNIEMTEFIQPEDGTIKSISLLGERNSGTRWIYGHLGECFNYTIPVHRSLSRYKHWFQYDDAKRIPKNTLSIAMFRDPMTWTYAMKKVPHHAPMHIDLPWQTFVTKEWTMDRLNKDEVWKEHQMKHNNSTGRICQESFRYHELVSCLTRPYPDGYWGDHNKHRFSQHQPFYEMKVNDPEGKPYRNILEMRADKIRNFMETRTYSNVKGFWHYQYEGLLKSGTEELVENIERATGVKRHPTKCKIYEPQNRRVRAMPPEFIDFMADNVDWEAESLIGYKKPSVSAVEMMEKMNEAKID